LLTFVTIARNWLSASGSRPEATAFSARHASAMLPGKAVFGVVPSAARMTAVIIARIPSEMDFDACDNPSHD
jgi:hypothetical protein